jgi:epoxyqueuosine reductase
LRKYAEITVDTSNASGGSAVRGVRISIATSTIEHSENHYAEYGYTGSMFLDEPGSELDSEAAMLRVELVRVLAVEAGFTEAGLLGLPHSDTSRDAERFEKWIGAGRAGTMQYLSRRSEAGTLVRAKLATPFPWARSAMVCFANYNSVQPRSIDKAPADSGWIARYAWSSRVAADGTRSPSDYHKVLLKRIKNLEQRLRKEFGEFEARAYVDTGPVVERALAPAAGLSAFSRCY